MHYSFKSHHKPQTEPTEIILVAMMAIDYKSDDIDYIVNVYENLQIVSDRRSACCSAEKSTTKNIQHLHDGDVVCVGDIMKHQELFELQEFPCVEAHCQKFLYNFSIWFTEFLLIHRDMGPYWRYYFAADSPYCNNTSPRHLIQKHEIHNCISEQLE